MPADPDMWPASDDSLNVHARPKPWPHRNLPDHIRERQERIRALPGWDAAHDFVWDWPRPPAEFAGMLESLTAHMVLPVAIVGPLLVDMGSYHVDESNGQLEDHGRTIEHLYVPLAHSEGGLSASLQRGMAAVLDAGVPVRTHVLYDRMTRDSCFVFDSTTDAVRFSRWVDSHADAMRSWLHDPLNALYAQHVRGVPRLSRHARLREVDTHVLGPACHVLYRYTTGEACGPNMITRNSFALNTEFVMPRFEQDSQLRPRRVLLEANMGGDKKPSAQYFIAGGHGKTVLADVSVREQTLRSVLRTTSRDLVELEHIGVHGSHASDMQSVAFTPASTVAALFAATGQDLGMVGTSSMAHDILEPLGEDAGVHMAIRFAGLEVGTVGGGTALPHARAFLSLLRCTGPGSAFRLAQIIAATALCLELSAAASAATPASENFAMAHLANSGRS
jgi:hydroxymethylglutaryl-CoA reductase (NADPH)